MTRTIHYVGMSEARYEVARRIFGGPAYYHRHMDARVYSEVGDSDVVIIGDARFHRYVWDASAVPVQYTD